MIKAKFKKNKGFTLVELMVVVVIIGILVAIAIPLYANVKDNTENSACRANLRTIDGSVNQWRMDDETNSGNPDLTTEIMGIYIIDPIICPTTKINTYSLDTNGKAICSNGHIY